MFSAGNLSAATAVQITFHGCQNYQIVLVPRVSIQKQQLLISTQFAICLHWLEGVH